MPGTSLTTFHVLSYFFLLETPRNTINEAREGNLGPKLYSRPGIGVHDCLAPKPLNGNEISPPRTSWNLHLNLRDFGHLSYGPSVEERVYLWLTLQLV